MARHPLAPWGSVTFGGVYWNCADRLDNLLGTVRPWFKKIVVVVQASPDDTLEVARKWADKVFEDKWHGRGDPSIQTVVKHAGNPWVFIVSDDEMPSEDLLNSFQDLAETLVAEQKNGAWIHFKSSIDGFDFTREQDNHLRFFSSFLEWPTMPHARVATSNTLHWPTGHISHDRSLDEMMQDYCRRWDLTKEGGWGATQIQAHNESMMRGACNAIAERKGWDYVTSFPWWEEVLRKAYGGKDPVTEGPIVVEKPVIETKPVRKTRTRRPTANK